MRAAVELLGIAAWIIAAHAVLGAGPRLERRCLAFALGTGGAAVAFVLGARLCGSPAPLAWRAGEVALCACIACACRARQAGEAVPPAWPRALRLAFAALCVLAALAFLLRVLAEPVGANDAWTMWAYRGKALTTVAGDWPRIAEVLGAAPNPDYPLLWPATVARWQLGTGTFHLPLSWLAAAGFAAAILGLTVATLSRLRGPQLAFAGGLLLLGNHQFVKQAATQIADVPLALFVTAACALCLFRSGRRDALLGGLCAGFCCLTKNEGVLVAATLCAAVAWHRRDAGAVGLYLLGCLPAFGLHALLRAESGWTNEIFHGERAGAIAAQLADPSRWLRTAGRCAVELATFGKCVPALLLVAVFAARALLGQGAEREGTRAAGAWLACCAAVLTGYVVVYVVSPYPPEMHTQGYCRLLLQLWPTAVITLLAVTPELPGWRDAAGATADPGRRLMS